MKLNYEERIALLRLLDNFQVGTIGFFKQATALQKALRITPEEMKELDWKEEDGVIKVNMEAVRNEKEIGISPMIEERVKDYLVRQDEKGTLKRAFVCLWEKFCGSSQDTESENK